MQYIAHTRFKNQGIGGNFNIPATSVCEAVDGVIMYKGSPVCFDTSENAHQFFAINDDNNGMMRGKLTKAIQKLLSKRDDDYQTRWDKIWGDPICSKYKRTEYEDYWLWNHDFFGAHIFDLNYIANLIGAKVTE